MSGKTYLEESHAAILSLREALRIIEGQLEKERRYAEEYFRELQNRKQFDDWMREAYPEVIEQYKAVMQLVKFMEDPPPTRPSRTPHYPAPYQTELEQYYRQAMKNLEMAREKATLKEQLEEALRRGREGS